MTEGSNNRSVNMLSTRHNREEYTKDECAIKDTSLCLANAVPNSLLTINNKLCNDNIKKLEASTCKPAAVVLVRLSEEIYKKDLYSKIKKYDQRKVKKDIKKKHQKRKSKHVDVLHKINFSRKKNQKAEKTSLDLNDQRKKEKQGVKDNRSFPISNTYILRNRTITRNGRKHIASSEIYNTCDSSEFVYCSSNRDNDVSFTKNVFQSKKHLDKRKYKRKYDNSLCEESVNIPDILSNQRKRKKITELNSKQNNNIISTSKLFPHSAYSNITNTQVTLTKLEDMHDNKYVKNWMQKSSKILLTTNLNCSEQYKNSSTNTSIKTVDSSHENITKYNECNISTEKSLSLHVLKPNYEESKYLKVLLVKLEVLGVSLKEQNLASKIEKLTAKYNNFYKLHFLTHSNNLIAHSGESDITKESTNEVSVHMKFDGEENDVIVKHPTNESMNSSSQQPAKSDKLTIQLESKQIQKNSPIKDVQDVYNSEKLSEKSKSTENMEYAELSEQSISQQQAKSEELTVQLALKQVQKNSPVKGTLQSMYNSEKLSDTSKSTENIEYAEVSKQSKTEEISTLPEAAEKLEAEVISLETLTSETNSQTSPKKDSRNSPIKKVDLLILSDVTSKRKLKEIQISPSTIALQEYIYLNTNNEIINSPDSINCELINILQNSGKTMVNEDVKSTLQKDQESNHIVNSSQLVIDKNISESNLADGMEDIGSLTETPINKKSTLEGSNNAITAQNLTTKTQQINELHSVNTGIAVNAEKIKKLVNDTCSYVCIVCNSSITDFKTFQLHLKECLAKPRERRNTNDNNITCNVSENSARNMETLKSHDTSQSSLQQRSCTAGNNNRSSSTLTKQLPNSTPKRSVAKSRKEKWKKFKMLKKQLQNDTDVRCSICSKVFDTMLSLSSHIYSHTERELQKAYKLAKMKQGFANDSEKTDLIITDRTEETQAINDDSSNKSSVESTRTENRKDEHITTNISTKQTKSKVNASNEKSNSPSLSRVERHEQPVESITFCDCHKTESNDDKRIELVLLCNVCNILFRTKECFEAHLEKSKNSSCNIKRLTCKVSKSYCSICKIILHSFNDIRRHIISHVKNYQRIKLLCHICKVRFIGMGPIFSLHWFKHMKDACYTASASNFPKTSLMDSKNKTWSNITPNEADYLVITEHVCKFCEVQFLSSSQLTNHVSLCPKNTNVQFSNLVPADSDKDDNIKLEHLSCNLCNLKFLEKSIFEAHITNHEQHSQPQYMCLPVTDIKRIYVCNICANVYENLQEFTAHWQDHNMNLMCNKCKTSFSTSETFIDHSKQCNESLVSVDTTSCRVTYHEDFSCKICNVNFESEQALQQHSGTHSARCQGLSTGDPDGSQKESNTPEISLPGPTNLQFKSQQPAVTSNHPAMETTTITDSNVTQINNSIPQISKNEHTTHVPTKPISSSKSWTDLKSVECLESDVDSVCSSDSQSTFDIAAELSSLASDVQIDKLNITQGKNCSEANDKSTGSKDEVKENEKVTAASNVNDHSNKQDDSRNGTTMKTLHSTKKTDVDKISSSFKDINVKETEMDDGVILIEPEITDKKKENSPAKNKSPAKKKSPTKISKNNDDRSTEAVTTGGLELNNSSKSNEKLVKSTKYLRVKNISELLDPKVKEASPKFVDNQESLKEHTCVYYQQQQQQSSTRSKNIPILSNELSNQKNKRQNVDLYDISNPSNLSQGHTLIVQVPNVLVQQPVYIPYNDSRAYTVPTQVPTIQCTSRSSEPVVHNINNQTTTNNTYVPSVSVQSQNLNQANEILLIKLLSSNTSNSSTPNLINNNYPAQSSSDAPMTTQPNLSSPMQSQDTHGRIKLQNAVQKMYSNKQPTATAVNIKAKSFNMKPPETSCLPMPSSSQCYSYGNTSDINYSSMGVANTQYSQQNNTTKALRAYRPIRPNNSGQVSTSYQPSSHLPAMGNTNMIPQSQQRYTIHHRSNTTPTTGAYVQTLYICHYCPKVLYFATTQELDNHLNVHHNYICDVCNERMFSSNELEYHKFKHDSTCLDNIFQS